MTEMEIKRTKKIIGSNRRGAWSDMCVFCNFQQMLSSDQVWFILSKYFPTFCEGESENAWSVDLVSCPNTFSHLVKVILVSPLIPAQLMHPDIFQVVSGSASHDFWFFCCSIQIRSQTNKIKHGLKAGQHTKPTSEAEIHVKAPTWCYLV